MKIQGDVFFVCLSLRFFFFVFFGEHFSAAICIPSAPLIFVLVALLYRSFAGSFLLTSYSWLQWVFTWSSIVGSSCWAGARANGNSAYDSCVCACVGENERERETWYSLQVRSHCQIFPLLSLLTFCPANTPRKLS